MIYICVNPKLVRRHLGKQKIYTFAGDIVVSSNIYAVQRKASKSLQVNKSKQSIVVNELSESGKKTDPSKIRYEISNRS